MHKRLNQLFIVLLVFSLLLVSLVEAAPGPASATRATVWDSIYDGVLKPIFVDFATDSSVESLTKLTIFLKVLLGILLFAIIYAILGMRSLHGFPSNVRVAIAAVLAVLSVVLMPAHILASLALTYGLLFFGLLFGVPIAGGVYLLLTHFREKTRANYAFKALVAFGLALLLGQFANLGFGFAEYTTVVLGGKMTYGTPAGPVTEALPSFWNGTVQISSFLAGLTFIFGLYFAVRAVAPWGIGLPDEETTTASSHSFGERSLWGGFRLPEGTRYVRALRDEAEPVINDIVSTAAANNEAGVRTAIGRQNQILTNMGTLLTTLSADVAAITDTGRRGTLDPLVAEYRRANTGVRTELTALLRHINPPAPAGGAAPAPNWAQVNLHAGLLRGHFDDALTAVETLARLLNSP